MNSANIFERVSDMDTPDAVTVWIFELDGTPVAEVSWPPVLNGPNIEFPALGNPRPVPAAMNAAMDEMRRRKLRRIVIHLQDDSLWNDEWGTLE